MGLFNDKTNVTNVDSFDCFDEKNNLKEESKKDAMDLIFILDKSGSMYGLVEDTIGGYNSYIERERAKGEKILVTLVLFDTEYRMLYSRKPIEEVEELTREQYFADGCTALLDAIGRTILSFDKEIKNKVLCVITTDGLENASKEFSKDQVKDLIESRDWEFLFIGANIDSYSEAFTLGIDDDHTANYTANSTGVSALFDSVENYRGAYSRDEHERGVNWREEGLD